MKGTMITNYPNYTITEEGEVFSNAQTKTKPLNPQKTSQNKKYLQVSLYNKDSKRHPITKQKIPDRLYVHRLVWETFVGDIPKEFEIDHVDKNPLNNNLNNLRLLEKGQNISRGRYDRWGYSVSDFRDEIFHLRKQGYKYREIADKTGLSVSAISREINKTKKTIYYETRVQVKTR